MPLSKTLTPREIVSELDKFIIGQDDAKRSVAIALRNRWRRQQVSPELRDEIAPKNIIMIGPHGCRQNGNRSSLSQSLRILLFSKLRLLNLRKSGTWGEMLNP